MALVLGATALYVVLRALGPRLGAHPRRRRWDAQIWRGGGGSDGWDWGGGDGCDALPPHAPPIRVFWYRY